MNRSRLLFKHVMANYSDLKRKGIPTHATAWRNCGDMMLSEMSQTLKENTV